jgi:hypothetical protein
MAAITIVIVGLLVFDLLAIRFGSDSRDDWPR